MEFFRDFGGMPLSRKIYFIYAIIGITAGMSAGPTFLYRYHNYTVFTLAMITMLCGILLFYMLWANHKMTLVNWSNTKFRLIIWINGIIGAAGLISMIVFLVWGTIVREPLLPMPQGNNKWMIAVWSWMASKWASSCSFSAYRLQRKISAQSITITESPIPA